MQRQSILQYYRITNIILLVKYNMQVNICYTLHNIKLVLRPKNK